MKKELVLHLGVHRAGSTTIQALLRRRAADLSRRAVRAFLRPDLDADPLLAQLLAMHRTPARGLLAALPLLRARASTVIVSEENLLGTMPGLDAGFYPGHARAARGLSLLARLFEVKVRWIVRRQDHWLQSLYAFRVARGATIDFATFARPLAEAMHFLPIARALGEITRSELRIGLFEDLFPGGSERALGRFLGVAGAETWSETLRTGNAGLRGENLHVLRFVNRELPALGMAERKALAAALRERPEGFDDTAELAQLLERAVGPGHRALAGAALAFAEAQARSGLDAAARRELMARYAEENATLLRLPCVEGDPECWRADVVG